MNRPPKTILTRTTSSTNRERKRPALPAIHIAAFLLLCSSAGAQDPPAVTVQDRLQRAVESLDQNLPDESLRILETLETDEPRNPWMWYLRGRARMLRNEPYQAMESLDRALDELAASPTPDEALAERIRAERRAARRQVHSLSLRAGFAYDSNVTFRGGGVSELISGQRDYKGFTGLNWDFAPIVTRDEAVVVGVRLAHSWYTDIDEYDDQNYGAYARYARRLSDHWRSEIQYDYDFILLGRDAFLSNHAVTPRITYVWPVPPRASGAVPRARLLETSFDYRIEAQDFLFTTRREFDRDGYSNSFGLDQSARFRPVANLGWDWDISAGYHFVFVPTEGSEFDRHTHDFSLALLLPLDNVSLSNQPASLRFSAEWELDDYLNPSFYDIRHRERRDLFTTLGLVFSQTLADNDNDGQIILHTFFQWTDADSNIRDRERGEPFSYEKILAGVQLEWRF